MGEGEGSIDDTAENFNQPSWEGRFQRVSARIRAAAAEYTTPECFSSPTAFLMPYPEALVAPMRQELTRLGVSELRTAEEVERALDEATEGTTLAIINSVCGCAAANARPAVALVQNVEPRPDRAVTVFAGQDLEATARLREHLVGIPPSSPFMALLKDGDPVAVLERRHIEGRSASAIAEDLKTAFERFCGDGAKTPPKTSGEPEAAAPNEQAESGSDGDDVPSTFRSIL